RCIRRELLDECPGLRRTSGRRSLPSNTRCLATARDSYCILDTIWPSSASPSPTGVVRVYTSLLNPQFLGLLESRPATRGFRGLKRSAGIHRDNTVTSLYLLTQRQVEN